LVAVDQRSDPVVPAVGGREPGLEGQAVRRGSPVPPVLASQPEDGEKVGRAERGGVFTDGIHFRYQGGQVRSLLSLVSYLGSGEYRDRYLGIKVPPTNLQASHLQAAREFADALANRLLSSADTH
jgi:hypothetical protein